MAKNVDNFGNKRVPNPSPASYAAGKKHYGGGRSAPNVGAVADLKGYKERDNKAAARKAALRRRLKAQSTGNPMNKNVLMGGASGGGFI